MRDADPERLEVLESVAQAVTDALAARGTNLALSADCLRFIADRLDATARRGGGPCEVVDLAAVLTSRGAPPAP